MPAGGTGAVTASEALIALSGLQPAWPLTGGAALAGFHTKHRETRDLDLFFNPATREITYEEAIYPDPS